MKTTLLPHLLAAGIAGAFAQGCALPMHARSADTGNLTAGMVKAEIVKGTTTQAEILEVFGAPNLVTVSSEDDEVWSYSRMAFQSASSTGGVLAILWPGSTLLGGGATSSTASSTTRSFDLILVFDENDVVRRYTVIQAAYGP